MATAITLFSGSASGTGASFEVLSGRRIGYSMTASGGSVGTASLQGSFDGIRWFNLDGSVALGAYEETNAIVRFLRVLYDNLGTVGTATIQALQSDED